MNNKQIVILAAAFLGTLIIAFGIFYFYNKGVNSSPVDPEVCKGIAFNGENAQNIVFFSDKSTAQKYYDYLLTIAPLNKNSEKFNAFYIDSYEPICEIYKEIALLCYSKEIVKKAASCPVDYIVVLKKESDFIRSSAYLNVMSLNSRHPLSVFTHEFGHAFANFAEEYTPAKLQRGQKNCVQECTEFPEFKDGCYVGCSEEDYKRSIDEGVMRTLSSEIYGKYNEFLLEERISEESPAQINNQKITGNAIINDKGEIDCANQEYYLLEFYYQDGNVISIDKSVEKGCFNSNGYGSDNYEILLQSNEEENIAFSDKFNAEFIFTDGQTQMQEEINGEVFDREGTFVLKLPIVENAEKLKINVADKSLGMDIYDLGGRPCKI